MASPIPLLVLTSLVATPFQEPKEVLVIGRAVSARDGSAVPRGNLSIGHPGHKLHQLRIQDGAFSGRVPAGDGYLLMGWAPGFGQLRLNNASVYEGMDPLRLEFHPTLRFEGRIVDPDLKGIAGTDIWFSLDPDGEDALFSVRSVEDGSFWTEAAVDPGEYYLLVSHPLYEDLPAVTLTIPTDEPLLVELLPRIPGSTGSVAGSVRLAGGPLAGVRIQLSSQARRVYRSVESDQEGRFAFSELAPGPYDLSVDHPAIGDAFGRVRQLEIGNGEAAPVHFGFTGSETASGLVLGADGLPLEGAWVSLQTGFTESYPLSDSPEEEQALRRRAERRPVSYRTETDAGGRFRFEGLEPGPYLLWFRCGSGPGGCQETLLSVEVPWEGELEVLVERGIDLRAVLLDTDGSPISRFGYSIDPFERAGSSTSTRVDSLEGTFVIPNLQRARYTLQVGLADGREAEAVIDLELGANIVFQMPRIGAGELKTLYRR